MNFKKVIVYYLFLFIFCIYLLIYFLYIMNKYKNISFYTLYFVN